MLIRSSLLLTVLACRTVPTEEKVVDDVPTEENTPPTVDGITIEPVEDVYADTIVQCLAEASDADEDSIALTHEWTGEDGSILGSDAELQLSPDVVSP